MSEYIEREAANEVCRECVRKYPNSFYNGIEAVRSELRKLPAADVRPVPEGGIGEMSDGYHTFNGLYYAVKKDTLLKVIRWFWDNCVEAEEGE